MLQGNLRRMKACHEADRSLDARAVVPVVWMLGCAIVAARLNVLANSIGLKIFRGIVVWPSFVSWCIGCMVSLIAVLPRPRMLHERRRFAWTTARTAPRMAATRMAAPWSRTSCAALPYVRLSGLR